MGIDKTRYPDWLIALSITQFSGLLVFMSFAGALPIIQSEWGLSNSQAGIIQSAGQIGYVIAVVFISSLTDYIDPKRMVVGGTLWAGVCNLLLAGLAYDTVSASILRGLVGFGIAGIYMPGIKLITQKTSGDQRGRSVGIFVGAFTLGAALSIALGGNLASLFGWRLAFSLTSLGPLIGAVVAWRLIPGALFAPDPTKKKGSSWNFLQDKRAQIIILIYVCHAWEVLGLRSWLAAYLTTSRLNAGFTLAEATSAGATVAGFATLLAATATASFGAMSDRFNRRKIIVNVMIAEIVVLLALGFSMPLPWMLIIIISLLATFLTNADSAVISARLTELIPEEYLGRTLALYSFLGFTAGSISPLVFGWALDYFGSNPGQPDSLPWIWAFATLAVGSVAGLFFASRLSRQTNPVRA